MNDKELSEIDVTQMEVCIFDILPIRQRAVLFCR